MASDCYLPSVTQGCSWSRIVTWDDSSGDPLDLSGYTGRLQFRRGSSMVLELSSTLGGVSVGTTDGKVNLGMSPDQTAELPEGTLSFGLVMTSPAGEVTELLTGALAVLPARVYGDSPADTFPDLVPVVALRAAPYNGASVSAKIDCTGYAPTLAVAFSEGYTNNVAVGCTVLVEESDDDLTWTQIGNELTTPGQYTSAYGTFTRSQRYVRVSLELTQATNTHCCAVVLLRAI